MNFRTRAANIQACTRLSFAMAESGFHTKFGACQETRLKNSPTTQRYMTRCCACTPRTTSAILQDGMRVLTFFVGCYACTC
jgi:hypothetical protein